jgi:aspartyl protease family protein
MKYLIFLFLLFTITGYSQSLSIEETIKYLNKLSYEHPGIGYYESAVDGILNAGNNCEIKITYRFSYNSSKSSLSVQETMERISCPAIPKSYKNKNEKGNWIKNGNLYSFEINDFDQNGIELISEKSDSRIEVNGNIGYYEFDSTQNKYSGLGLLRKQFRITCDNPSYLKVFFNGLRYLIAIAKEQIVEEKEDIVDDPFINQKPASKTESKIPLSQSNGVFNLNVVIGGKVLSKFILDSGAGECNISTELEKKLIANGIIMKSDYLTNGLYKLADGSIVENRRINLSKMRIGNKTISNVVVSVSSRNSPNLLGQTFLKKLEQWSIDNSKNILIIK